MLVQAYRRTPVRHGFLPKRHFEIHPIKTTIMSQHLLRSLSFFILSILFFACQNEPGRLAEQLHEREFPSDYMFRQRSFPTGEINRDAYKTAIRQAMEMRRAQVVSRNDYPWQPAGPTNVGGRITSLAADPSGQTIYAGAATGGIWKTTDDGLNWTPIFDAAPTLSIGDIAVAASDPQTIYAGTGEANPGGGSLAYDGLGVFKTTNGGGDWESIGLEDIGSVGKLIVHPTDPDRVFVAAMGYLFENNSDRGVFRTVNGGQTWEKVLFVNDSTGAVDLAFHPTDPDIVYAATWERVRRQNFFRYGGPGCAIWRSVNGGDDWQKLEGGLPQTDNGRIGLAVTPDRPDLLMALYEDSGGGSKGVYRSYNKGVTWTAPEPGGQGISYPGYGWWFGKIYIDPNSDSKVFALGVSVHSSVDGAATFSEAAPEVHADQHALYFDPNNSDRMVLGNDGGVYFSYDGGATWDFRSNIPITQFYTCEIDNSNPEQLYGGTQDNGTWRTLSGAEDGFEHIIGGDGFYVSVNPDDPDYILGEFQGGGLMVSGNGGSDFQYVGIQIAGRNNWSTPIVRDPSDPATVYSASEVVYKSTDNGFNWTAISSDLTNGFNGSPRYATISSLDVSPLNGQVIWAGTDDGNVQVSVNGGSTWTEVSGGLPLRWVTRVVADPFDEATAYVTFSGYRYNDYLPHVFKTTDFGGGWEDISGNLPEAPANDLVVDPGEPDWLYLATDVGVFETTDGGLNWSPMGQGLPNVPVTDLDHHDGEFFLLAATYGRSFYKIPTRDPTGTKPPKERPRLFAVSPNPVFAEAKIVLDIEVPRRLDIGVYDLLGRKVAGIFNGALDPGEHVFYFNKTKEMAAGAYFVRAFGEQVLWVEKVLVQ